MAVASPSAAASASSASASSQSRRRESHAAATAAATRVAPASLAAASARSIVTVAASNGFDPTAGASPRVKRRCFVVLARGEKSDTRTRTDDDDDDADARSKDASAKIVPVAAAPFPSTPRSAPCSALPSAPMSAPSFSRVRSSRTTATPSSAASPAVPKTRTHSGRSPLAGSSNVAVGSPGTGAGSTHDRAAAHAHSTARRVNSDGSIGRRSGRSAARGARTRRRAAATTAASPAANAAASASWSASSSSGLHAKSARGGRRSTTERRVGRSEVGSHARGLAAACARAAAASARSETERTKPDCMRGSLASSAAAKTRAVISRPRGEARVSEASAKDPGGSVATVAGDAPGAGSGASARAIAKPPRASSAKGGTARAERASSGDATTPSVADARNSVATRARRMSRRSRPRGTRRRTSPARGRHQPRANISSWNCCGLSFILRACRAGGWRARGDANNQKSSPLHDDAVVFQP